MKINHKHYIITIIAVLFLGSCKKEGEFLTKPIKAIRPFDMTGYAIGDALELYFDDVKIRDYYGKISLGTVSPQLAFENDVTIMQLRKKSTGEVVYEQKFNIADAKNEVPKFYFNGTSIAKSYPYPKPQGKDYLVNFYFDGPKDLGPVDVQMEVLEYYYDNNNNLVVVNTTGFPIATGIAIGKWSEYLKIQPPPVMLPTQPGTDFYLLITLKSSKTKKYLLNGDVVENALQIELPDQWTSSGKTQSIHIQTKIADNKALYFELNDLVQMFP